MQNLDIVELIETNPITKLSNTYNNKLLLKIKEKFNESEQKMFITSFYCYLNYNQKNEFVIDLDNVWKWLEFTNKANAKKILQKYFTLNIDYINLLDANIKQENAHGGNNKEIFMLTVRTFKLFCIKAGTEKAKEIHEYFVKLEELLQEIIEEESSELKLQLKQKNNEILENKEDYNKKILKETEKILLREFGNIGSLVYLIKVKTYDDGTYVLKIGESRKGVLDRYNEHKIKYDEVLLLDCFMVKRSKDFESFIHNNPNVKDNKVSNLNGHENEKELFLIGNNLTYSSLLKLIKNNIKNFNDANVNDYEIEKMKLEYIKLNIEYEKIKMLNEDDKKIFVEQILKQELINNNSILLQKIENLEKTNNNTIILNKIENLEKTNKEILEKLTSMQIKTTTNFNEPLSTLGPRLQKINPDTFEIVKVYESVNECMKENYKIKRPSINKAIIKNTIYEGYRWLLVDRELDPNVIHNIMETTKLQKIQNLGYIAKLNNDKTEIINVYIDRKTAAEENNYSSLSALDNPVKNCTITNGHYYMLYDSCEDDVKDEFEIKNNNSEPILYKDGVGQYDNKNNLVQEFICKYDCIRTLHISDRTLKKAIDSNKEYNNYFYKYLGSKLKCL
jgi:hypothetical protein